MLNGPASIETGSSRVQQRRRSHTNDREALRQALAREARGHSSSSNSAQYIGYAILAVAFLLIAIGAATAHEYTGKGMTVTHPWARATPGGVTTGGAYLEMRAAKGHADRLIGGRTEVAGAVELHTHIMEGGIAKMRRVDAIPIKAGTSMVLKPSGYHLMLTDLKAPLKQGDLVKLILVFEKAGEIEVEATVEPIGAMGPHGFDKQPASAGQHKH
jgi:periplasmic copper chaperone A